jgi:uncharacterized protein YuzE
MKITYDKDVDAAYVYLKSENMKVENTEGEWPFRIDLDATEGW